MDYQETSRQALNSVSGITRITQCIRLKGLYKENPQGLCDKEVKQLLGWDINIVTARRNDLVNKCDTWGNPAPEVELKGKKKYNGRNVNIYGIIDEDRQGRLF